MLVLGIDVGLLRTGVAALVDGRIEKVFTIAVEGDPKDTGPRYAYLRQSLSIAAGRIIAVIGQPTLIALEIPDEDEGEDGLREGHEKMDVAKVYGAYAVLYAESSRLWPKAHLVSVTPAQWKGPYPKSLTVGRMRAKYPEAKAANQHEWDGVGIADWGWDVADAMRKNLTSPIGRKV